MKRFNVSLKFLTMARCKYCKSKFEVKHFNRKFCYEDNCIQMATKDILKTANEVKLKNYSKLLRKNNTTPKAKKKTSKELLQIEVNKLSRRIDSYFGYNCIDCHRVLEYHKPNAVHGAHRSNVGGHENIRFNLHNIHAATLFCNKHSTEHKTGYDVGLVERYGKEYFDMVHNLDLEYKVLRLNEVEIKEALKIVRKLNREFNQHTKGNDLDGSMMRSYFNNLIGIYK